VQAEAVAADVRVGRDLERIVRAGRRAREQDRRDDNQAETSTMIGDGLSLPTIEPVEPILHRTRHRTWMFGLGGATMPLPIWKPG
jgi:hypothetical protein